MSRRRYISTDISTDSKLAGVSRLAVILYTWGIPHAGDDCRLTPKNAAECRWALIPNQDCTIEEVETCIKELLFVGLWGVDENGRFFYPSDSFYKFQTYINAEKRRETPQIAASPSPSPSLKEDKKNKNSSFPVPEQVWPQEWTWLRDFVLAQNGNFPQDSFLDFKWWDALSYGCGGLSKAFLETEFAKMKRWIMDNPRREPTPKGYRKFVAGWLERAYERERRFPNAQGPRPGFKR